MAIWGFPEVSGELLALPVSVPVEELPVSLTVVRLLIGFEEVQVWLLVAAGSVLESAELGYQLQLPVELLPGLRLVRSLLVEPEV